MCDPCRNPNSPNVVANAKALSGKQSAKVVKVAEVSFCELELGRAHSAKTDGSSGFCCDKNVIVLCSETGQVDQNVAEPISGEPLKNRVE